MKKEERGLLSEEIFSNPRQLYELGMAFFERNIFMCSFALKKELEAPSFAFKKRLEEKSVIDPAAFSKCLASLNEIMDSWRTYHGILQDLDKVGDQFTPRQLLSFICVEPVQKFFLKTWAYVVLHPNICQQLFDTLNELRKKDNIIEDDQEGERPTNQPKFLGILIHYYFHSFTEKEEKLDSNFFLSLIVTASENIGKEDKYLQDIDIGKLDIGFQSSLRFIKEKPKHKLWKEDSSHDDLFFLSFIIGNFYLRNESLSLAMQSADQICEYFLNTLSSYLRIFRPWKKHKDFYETIFLVRMFEYQEFGNFQLRTLKLLERLKERKALGDGEFLEKKLAIWNQFSVNSQKIQVLLEKIGEKSPKFQALLVYHNKFHNTQDRMIGMALSQLLPKNESQAPSYPLALLPAKQWEGQPRPIQSVQPTVRIGEAEIIQAKEKKIVQYRAQLLWNKKSAEPLPTLPDQGYSWNVILSHRPIQVKLDKQVCRETMLKHFSDSEVDQFFQEAERILWQRDERPVVGRFGGQGIKIVSPEEAKKIGLKALGKNQLWAKIKFLNQLKNTLQIYGVVDLMDGTLILNYPVCKNVHAQQQRSHRSQPEPQHSRAFSSR